MLLLDNQTAFPMQNILSQVYPECTVQAENFDLMTESAPPTDCVILCVDAKRFTPESFHNTCIDLEYSYSRTNTPVMCVVVNADKEQERLMRQQLLKIMKSQYSALNYSTEILFWLKDELEQDFAKKMHRAQHQASDAETIAQVDSDDDYDDYVDYDTSAKSANINALIWTVALVIVGIVLGTLTGGLVGGLVIGGVAAGFIGAAIGFVAGPAIGGLISYAKHSLFSSENKRVERQRINDYSGQEQKNEKWDIINREQVEEIQPSTSSPTPSWGPEDKNYKTPSVKNGLFKEEPGPITSDDESTHLLTQGSNPFSK